jgi:meso-butanediol dehydrogenase / (S,S)-butanediol dehydrogenase / diacetyl reductase
VDRQTAFITGGAAGTGLASARLLAESGAAITLFDVPGTDLEKAAQELRAAGADVVAHEGEIDSPADLRAALDATVAEYGTLTSVVAAAATNVRADLEALDEELWARSVAVNLTAVFRLAKQTLPYLLENRGTFVAVASLAGMRAWPGQPASAATMHGIAGLVQTLGQDYGHQGVRYNVVCYGPVEGETGTLTGEPEERERGLAQIPFGRFARPEEVAQLVAHLSRDDSSYTNATVQTVDGGASVGFFAPED